MNHDDILNNRAELLQEQNGDDSGSLCHDELILRCRINITSSPLA